MPNKTITQRVYRPDMEWANNCMELLGIPTFAEFIKKWRKECKLGRHKKWYDNLPDIQKKQPLKGVCIQKKGADNKYCFQSFLDYRRNFTMYRLLEKGEIVLKSDEWFHNAGGYWCECVPYSPGVPGWAIPDFPCQGKFPIRRKISLTKERNDSAEILSPEGMSLLEIIKAYPEQVEKVMRSHNISLPSTPCPDCGCMGMPVGKGKLYCDECDKVFGENNKTHEAISAIEGALRIADLWLPKVVTEEHAGEAEALHKMHSAFLSVVQKQHHA